MFVDIHNHILPGIDDGAPTMGHAVEMARQAAQCGTDTLVATPHRAWASRTDAPSDWVRELVAQLQKMLDHERIALKIVPGVEIKIGPNTARELAAGQLLTLGDAGTWALIELPFDHIPDDAAANLRAVQDAGFQIVLAHPERYKDIQNDLRYLQDFVDLGLTLQITSGSILGGFGPKVQQAAEAILTHANEWPIAIASDAHDLEERNTGMMAKARDRAATFVGADAAQEMVDARPRSFLVPR